MDSINRFGEILRSVSVSYPIPFFCVAGLLFSLICFAMALNASGWLALMIATTGVLSFLASIFFFGFALLKRDFLLRSEKHVLQHRVIELVGDGDIEPTMMANLIKLLGHEEPKKRKAEVKRSLPSSRIGGGTRDGN